MQTIRHHRALRAPRISAGWDHNPAHYSYYRITPANQRNIPFDDAPRPLGPLAFWGTLVAVELIAVAVVLWVI